MKISSNFDSGNIKVIEANDPLNIQLEINNDHQSEFYQWFHFRLETTPYQLHKLNINNSTFLFCLSGGIIEINQNVKNNYKFYQTSGLNIINIVIIYHFMHNAT